MEILNAIASWNILGAIIAVIAAIIAKRNRDISQKTGESWGKKKALCILLFIFGTVYLTMPGWLQLIKLVSG